MIDSETNDNNEMEYFDSGCAVEEFHTGPDVDLIREMIEMVKQTSTYPDNIDYDEENVYEFCKIGTVNPPVTIKEVHDEKIKVHKRKRQRNVAIASILEMAKDFPKTSGEIENYEDKHLKLLKPDDFIKENASTSAAESPGNDRVTESSVVSEIKDSNPGVSSDKIINNEPKTFGTYRPSAMADVYYKKYLQRNKLNISMQDYYHSIVEKDAKELKIQGLGKVGLAMHRHELSNDCVVCKIFYKKFVATGH
ncbi:uncharacterized protein [Battus philenor]|uniref:uncharacterized protein isoform X2 n=1 Tax=Battus philenor TaxID=42288 RepID=UPI0035D1112F